MGEATDGSAVGSGDAGRLKVELPEVPETALWTLYHRAAEARRPDGVLDDPKAVELVDRIDFPFAERFGRGGGFQAQLQALRVGCFDSEVADFLLRHPRGTVVCLGRAWRPSSGGWTTAAPSG